MLTKPNTPDREQEVDHFLSLLRKRLVGGEFRSVTIDTPVRETEGTADGFRTVENTGDFVLTATAARY